MLNTNCGDTPDCNPGKIECYKKSQRPGRQTPENWQPDIKFGYKFLCKMDALTGHSEQNKLTNQLRNIGSGVITRRRTVRMRAIP